MLERAAILVVAVVACRSESKAPEPRARTIAIDPPAGAGAMAPWLRSDRGGVLASWLEPHGDGHRLVWSRWDGTTWSPPITITSGATIVANWADVPSIVRGNDGVLVAHWAAKREGGKYAYDAVVARSADGATWQPLGALHDDGTPTEHGFVSLVAEGPSVRAFWLDGRATENGGAMTVRTAPVGDTIGASEVVDDRVCDCCATGAAVAAQGPVVVYRDRSGDEIRDIAIARRGSTWSTAALDRDNWKIEGCPVNGPSIAAAGNRVVVAWYTMAADQHRVRIAFSDDGGATFRPAIDVDTQREQGVPLGRVGVVLDDNGSAIVSWLATTKTGASLLLRRVSIDGTRGREIHMATTSADRDAGFPRIARAGADVIVAWTETSAPKKLRTVKLAARDVP